MSLLPSPGTFAAFVAAAGAVVLLPGPDTVTVLSQGATGGRRAGALTALGVSAGVLVHASAVALGLAAVLRAEPAAYAAVKYAGAAYLCYLGVRTLRASDPLDAAGRSDGGAFRAGFLVNATNPKVAVFFLAFLPAFAGNGPGTSVRVLALGATYSALSAAYLLAVGAAAGTARTLLDSPRATRGIRVLSGSALLALGVALVAGIGP